MDEDYRQIRLRHNSRLRYGRPEGWMFDMAWLINRVDELERAYGVVASLQPGT